MVFVLAGVFPCAFRVVFVVAGAVWWLKCFPARFRHHLGYWTLGVSSPADSVVSKLGCRRLQPPEEVAVRRSSFVWLQVNSYSSSGVGILLNLYRVLFQVGIKRVW